MRGEALPLNRDARPGGCQVRETRPARCDCGLAAAAAWGPVNVCELHLRALAAGQ